MKQTAIMQVQLAMFVATCAFAAQPCFGLGSIAREQKGAAIQAKLCSDFLRFDEKPSLSEAAKDASAIIFRLQIMPTWGNKFVVCAERSGSTYILSSELVKGPGVVGGKRAGSLLEEKTVQLSEVDSSALDSLVANLGLFEMPEDDGIMLTDGDYWVVEGVSNGRYHLVHRQCPTQYNAKKRGLKAFNDLCKFLIDKSSLSDRPRNMGRKLI